MKFLFAFLLLVYSHNSYSLDSSINLNHENTPASTHKKILFLEKLSKAFELLQQDYAGDLDEDKLSESAIQGMLKSLDAHSAFFNSDALKEMQIHTSGNLEGIGIEISYIKGSAKIISPIDDGPAYKAGIKANDTIIAIDNQDITGWEINDVVEKIRGASNTSILIKVIREHLSEPIEFNIKRGEVEPSPVKTKIIDDILYLRLGYFYEGVSKSIEKKVKKILSENNNLKGIIIDLRNSPGGLLDESVKSSSIFLDRGNVVKTKSNHDESLYPVSDSVFKVKDKLLIVLINSGTASAAEIMASSLQDHNKAIVVGEKSFGKGSVQTVMPFDRNKAISITTSYYYSPLGKSIHMNGVTPDINIEDSNINIIPNTAKKREKDLQLNGKKSIHHTIASIPTNMKNHHKEITGDYMLIRSIDLIKSIKAFNGFKYTLSTEHD